MTRLEIIISNVLKLSGDEQAPVSLYDASCFELFHPSQNVFVRRGDFSINHCEHPLNMCNRLCLWHPPHTCSLPLVRLPCPEQLPADVWDLSDVQFITWAHASTQGIIRSMNKTFNSSLSYDNNHTLIGLLVFTGLNPALTTLFH